MSLRALPCLTWRRLSLEFGFTLIRYGLIRSFPEWHLQRPYFQKKPHSEVPSRCEPNLLQPCFRAGIWKDILVYIKTNSHDQISYQKKSTWSHRVAQLFSIKMTNPSRQGTCSVMSEAWSPLLRSADSPSSWMSPHLVWQGEKLPETENSSLQWEEGRVSKWMPSVEYGPPSGLPGPLSQCTARLRVFAFKPAGFQICILALECCFVFSSFNCVSKWRWSDCNGRAQDQTPTHRSAPYPSPPASPPWGLWGLSWREALPSTSCGRSICLSIPGLFSFFFNSIWKKQSCLQKITYGLSAFNSHFQSTRFVSGMVSSWGWGWGE